MLAFATEMFFTGNFRKLTDSALGKFEENTKEM
jgi:hypothetical protein